MSLIKKLKNRFMPLFLSLFVSLALVLSCGPLAYAVGGEGQVGEQSEVQAGVQTKVQAEGQAPPLEAFAPLAGPYDLSYTPLRNSTVVTIEIANAGSLTASSAADAVTIQAVMRYGADTVRTISQTFDLNDVAAANNKCELDFEVYGKFSVTAKFTKGATTVHTAPAQTVGVTADQYNISPVSATLPLTYFSLAMWDDGTGGSAAGGSILDDGNGGVIPTVLLLERPASYSWDNLPAGVYGLPFISTDELTTQPADFDDASQKFRRNTVAMAAYVNDLIALDPSSTINLYIADYYLGLIHSIIYANRVQNYKLTIISDGSFSYTKFKAVYGNSSPASTHLSLTTAWNNAKQAAYNTGSVASGFLLDECTSYLYAAVDLEPNAQWWMARTALLESGDVAFTNQVKANPKVMQKSISQLLLHLQAQGLGAVSNFKALYNFNGTYFADAESSGKKAMMFLGTTIYNENNKFSDYARFVIAYYGRDDYAYYYKGHPGTPTGMYPEKQTELRELGVVDVDSSIAAELILFFYPDIYISGYSSSTYASVDNAQQACGMFAKTKAAAAADGSADYLSLMDFFISPADAVTDETVKQLIPEGDTCYLVEFSDSIIAQDEYSLAIWDSTLSMIFYYKKDGSTYTLVKTVQGGGSFIDGGVYTISSKLDKGKVLDIAGASRLNGANAQLYADNQSPAQRYRLAHAGGSYYTLKCVESGKVLDVEGADKKEGTNVSQYDENGTDAQRWKLVDTGDGDGSYYLQSKCNDLFLDAQWGNADNGTNLWVWSQNGSNAQKFYLNEIKPLVQDGTYTINSVLDAGKAVDVDSASTHSTANIQLYTANGTGAQKFAFKYDAASGYYTITNTNSSKVIDVRGGSLNSGENVWQYESNGSKAQKWSIVSADAGQYYLYSATGGGCCLDVLFAQTADGTNIQVYTPNKSNAQKWTLNAA